MTNTHAREVWHAWYNRITVSIKNDVASGEKHMHGGVFFKEKLLVSWGRLCNKH